MVDYIDPSRPAASGAGVENGNSFATNDACAERIEKTGAKEDLPGDGRRDKINDMRTMRFFLPPLALTLLTLALATFGKSQTLPRTAAMVGSRQPVEAKYLVNSLGMKFVLIPPGKFLMGSPETETDRGDDEFQHEVVLTKEYYLGVYEVTQGQYQRVMGENPSYFTPDGLGKAKVRARETTQCPVENVTWHQAVAFCKKLSELPEEKSAKRQYRLPTEAEWEYACRAGTTTALHYGDKVNSYAANFNGLSPYGSAGGGPFHRVTMPVGQYAPNKFGLYDMHGNVMEWCHDWYAADYYRRSPKFDPPGPATGTEKVTRGGSWANSGKACRSAVRTRLAPDDSHYGLGFRVVLVK